MDGFGTREIGLYMVGFVEGLLDFRLGIIFARYQVLFLLLCRMEGLKMSARVLTACGPRYLTSMYDMPSESVTCHNNGLASSWNYLVVTSITTSLSIFETQCVFHF